MRMGFTRLTIIKGGRRIVLNKKKNPTSQESQWRQLSSFHHDASTPRQPDSVPLTASSKLPPGCSFGISNPREHRIRVGYICIQPLDSASGKNGRFHFSVDSTFSLYKIYNQLPLPL